MAQETSLSLSRRFWTTTAISHVNEVRKECQGRLSSSRISFVLSSDNYAWFCALGRRWLLGPYKHSVCLDTSLCAADKASEDPGLRSSPNVWCYGQGTTSHCCTAAQQPSVISWSPTMKPVTNRISQHWPRNAFHGSNNYFPPSRFSSSFWPRFHLPEIAFSENWQGDYAVFMWTPISNAIFSFNFLPWICVGEGEEEKYYIGYIGVCKEKLPNYITPVRCIFHPWSLGGQICSLSPQTTALLCNVTTKVSYTLISKAGRAVLCLWDSSLSAIRQVFI